MKQKLALAAIQQLQLKAINQNLYLDIHPDDKKAINEYNTTFKELRKAKKEYEAIYGPLANYGSSRSKCTWQWVQSPWPWEI